MSLPPTLEYSLSRRSLYRPGQRFDGWSLSWTDDADPPADRAAITLLEGLAAVFCAPGSRRLPVGVIGPKQASAAQMVMAQQLGRRLAMLGLTLLCGGKGGVMEAACRGAHEAGGLTIGLLPDEEWSAANPFVGLPVATGLGPARNIIIARACPVLIAVGGEYGTLSEIAFGLHFGRRVLTLLDAPAIPGTIGCASVETALERTALRLLELEQA